jgi:hypothetical protein
VDSGKEGTESQEIIHLHNDSLTHAGATIL